MPIQEIITIPKNLTPEQREVIAEEVLDFIRDRTFAGMDKNNQRFPKYEKDYAKKKGVNVGDVDLVLSGEMMDELRLIRHKVGEIVIGYDGRKKKLNAKAEGNILGSYGGDPNPDKARDYLGISRKDLMDIVNTYTGEGDE